jgi:signal transduction histidine kinase
MSHLSRVDKLLLGTLLPLFLIVFTLHVREAARTGIAQAPFFAAPDGDERGYPQIGGPRLEHGVDRSGLRVGDLLIRVGDVDLRGYGYFGFDAVVVEQAGLSLRTPLLYERDGVRGATELELLPYPQPFARIPFLLGAAVVGTIVLLRAPRSRHSRLVFTATLSLAIFELHFFGGSRWQSYASLILFNFGGGVAMWALIRWMIEFPVEVPDSDRLSPAWAWIGVVFVLVRINYLLGGPIPSETVPAVALATDAIFMLTMISILTWNTLHATAVGRRRSKWFLFGGYVTVVPMLLGLFLSLVEVPGFEHFETLPYVMLLGAVFPLSMLVAIIRYDLFDIDRIVSSAASYSLAVAAVLAVLVATAPTLIGAVSQSLGLGEQATSGLLGAALLVVAVPLGRVVRTRIDQLAFPERRRRETGFRQLFVDLSECNDASELVRFLGDRVQGLLDPECAFVLVRSKAELAPLLPSSAPSLLTLPARGRLALELESHPTPRLMNDAALTRLDAKECDALSEAGVRLVVPLRQGKELVALLCIGEQRSGDIYTSADLTLLGAAAEKARSELDRLRDVSSLELERVRSAELAALKEEAEQANLAKSRFLAAASHDLRQPLHALGLFVDRLGARVSGEEASDLVDKIRTSTDSLNDMFTTLLDMSRLDAGAVAPDVVPVDVDRQFARLDSEFGPLAREKGIVFEVQSDGLTALTDPQLLARILQNLVSNAIQYTERGRVSLVARRLDDDIEIDVTDTGVGIPAERRREIFEEFVQLDSEGLGRAGIGLGLSIVDRLVRVLGHRIALESTPGRGTRFTLSLPASAESAPRPPLLDTRNPTALDGARVVVVDDDLAVLNATRATLQDWGCSVVVATNTEDALEGIEQRGKPDAILADYRLQRGETGTLAIERIRKAVGRSVPAAVVTGDSTPEILAELADRNLEHVAKPLTPIALRALLTELLQNN